MMLAGPATAQTLKLDERPAEAGTWGDRPDGGSVSQTDPPSFSWRPQKGLT
jgi:hypothetical protein